MIYIMSINTDTGTYTVIQIQIALVREPLMPAPGSSVAPNSDGRE